jgi:ElaB/YqjD/DUF883 family membrane-anchored ribosome-binding protein
MQTQPLLTEPATNRHRATSTPKNAGADATPSGITQEFQDFVADMEDLIKASTSLTGDDLARAKAKLYARVAAARAFVEEMPGAISARARSTAKLADGYVREQPWRTIGITAAVGLLIGFLLGRREE